ncbi:MAG TPA: MFS transporter [Thermoleophilaceae bacterium]
MTTRAAAGPAAAADMSGLLVGAAGMFATMYATQPILPVLEREFSVAPSQTGLTISVVVIAVAVAGWVWGPVSDRIGRKSALVLASALLTLPTIAVALAPTFPLLLLCRTLQGLCMPGLLIVGVPYVAEVFTPGLGGRAMGLYVASLFAGGVVGRVGVGLLTAATSWRLALGLLAILPVTGAVVMRRTLPEGPAPPRSGNATSALRAQLRNTAVLRPAAAASALFFTFVSTYSYATFRLHQEPFNWGTGTTSLVFSLWALGFMSVPAGKLADRAGWRRVSTLGLLCSASGVLLSLPAEIFTLVPALALVISGMFVGVTSAQLGVSAAGDVDRGAASAIYFTLYYVAGALAGFGPGLAWEKWGWPGVAVCALCVLTLGLGALRWGDARSHWPARGLARANRRHR